jgi:hypothetical protein
MEMAAGQVKVPALRPVGLGGQFHYPLLVVDVREQAAIQSCGLQ